MTTDCVYVIGGEHGRVKIGSSGDPYQRCRDLQTGSPFRLWIEHVTSTLGPALPVELEAHALLSRHRLNGEWFDVPPDVAVATIAAAAYRLGVPVSANGKPFEVPVGPPYIWRHWLLGSGLAATPFWGFLALDARWIAMAYMVAVLAAAAVWLLARGNGQRAPGNSLLRWLGVVLAGCAAPAMPAILLAVTVWP